MIYKVRLKPLDDFFFGGEQGFGFGHEKNENYLIRSNTMPQQTTILGALRKLVLEQSGLLKNDFAYSKEERDKITQLIGDSSFDIAKPFQSFGAIKKLYPLYIVRKVENKEREIFKTPFDAVPEEPTYIPYNIAVRDDFEHSTFFYPVDYSCKKYLFGVWIDLETKELLKNEAIFTEVGKIGIRKNRQGGTNEKALFKKFLYRMASDCEFALYLDSSFEFEDGVVFLGLDRSPFKICFEKVSSEEPKTFYENSFKRLVCQLEISFKKQTRILHKVVLLSDSLVSEDFCNYYEYGITDKEEFRNLISRYQGNTLAIEKNQKYIMLKRGSVFYTWDKEKFFSLLEEQQNLQLIGYNFSGQL